MNQLLLLGSAVIIACILANRITSRFGIPMLLAFIGLGMRLDQRDFLEFLLIISDLLQTSAQLLLFLLCFTEDSEHDGKQPGQSPGKRFFFPRWERYSLLS